MLEPQGDRRQQVDGAGGLDPVRAAGAGRGGNAERARHGRVEPGVPPRGPGGPRLPAPRSHRDRLRRPGVGRARLGALPRRARAGARDRPRVGGDDQVRVERVPRDEDLVHQRDRQRVRGGRRRRARGRDRHGLRRAHRLPVPASRPGLRRFVLPEGRRPRCCTPRARPATTSSSSTVSSRSISASTIASSTRSAPRPAARSPRRRDRDLGAHVQGRHRRPPRLAVARDRAQAARRGRDRACLRSGRRRGGRGARSRSSTCGPIRTKRRPAPMSWRCSPSGKSCAGSTSSG